MIFRKATFRDVEAMQQVINQYADQGLMLARSRNMLYETLRDFVLAEQDGRIVGVGALHMVWDELAEIRALAVTPDAVGKGVGRKIVETLAEEAKELGIKTLFALTYQPQFFERLGFHRNPKKNYRIRSGKNVSIVLSSLIATRLLW